ncbi:MAG: peptidase M23, partial [Pseudomonadales bacterium]
HYEFLVNGVHRNPRTIIKKLPKAKKLAKAKLPAFNTAIDSRREILQHFSQQFELAALQQAE